MNRNIYHLLGYKPALEAFETNSETELLAQKMVKSGLLRIDTVDKSNFVRYAHPYGKSFVVFSYRQLYDDHLLITTRNILRYILGKQDHKPSLEKMVDKALEKLRYEVDKSPRISEEIELKVARALIQACHPAIIYLLLWEEVEVFVTYSYSIGDLLDVQSFESQRWNNGMQTTYGKDYGIFVSCAGDPFDETKPGATEGDGMPALARMMVIAGQELGHYSDIIRDKAGNPISRHSTNLNATHPKAPCRQARHQDLQYLTSVLAKTKKLGLHKLVEEEKQYQFFEENKLQPFSRLFIKIAYALGMKWFFFRCSMNRLGFLSKLPRQLRDAAHIEMAIGDTLFNLAPQSDAYDSPNPVVKEALACVEALARVPQQVQKWGHPFISHTMPNLYHIYYHQVIPSCVKTYEQISGAKFKRDRSQQAWWRRLRGYLNFTWRGFVTRMKARKEEDGEEV